MFGASVSELYLLIESLINIGRALDLCVIDHKKINSVHRNCESGLAMTYKHPAHGGPAHAAGRGGGIDRWQHSSYFFYMRYR